MDFTNLKDVPFQYILAGIAIFYIKLDKDREKRNGEIIEKKDKQIEDLIHNFLTTLNKFEKLDSKVEKIDKKLDKFIDRRN